MSRVVRFDDRERRARLVARHLLRREADGSLEAVRALVAVHSSDPLTPYLALWARVPGFSVAQLERALYEDRTLWRLHAMRRTLFVVPTDDVPVIDAAACRRIADQEQRRIERWLAAEVDVPQIGTWLDDVREEVTARVGGGGEWTTRELAEAVPELSTQLTLGSGRWATRVPLSSRLLLLMAMELRVVRTRPAGSWRSSQYRWADVSTWLGTTPARIDDEEGDAELARRYLYAYGPATSTDLKWWTGWTTKRTARALDDVGAVGVHLRSGGEGFVLPDDVEPTGGDATSVCLLPGLDPTPMGWKERDWYLGPRTGPLFDGNGNIGPTVWVDGQVVGGWGQRPDGEVVTRLLSDVGEEAAGRVSEEAAALTAWLDGVVVTPRFRTPLERELSQ